MPASSEIAPSEITAGASGQPVRKSVYRRSYVEILAHKWNTSREVGYDRGEAAMKEWVQFHWKSFLRARWVEHLQGKEFWAELYQCDFGLLQRKFHDRRQLLDDILSQFKAGKENLDVLDWATAQKLDLASVLEILEALDVSSCRLQHEFDPTPEGPDDLHGRAVNDGKVQTPMVQPSREFRSELFRLRLLQHFTAARNEAIANLARPEV